MRPECSKYFYAHEIKQITSNKDENNTEYLEVISWNPMVSFTKRCLKQIQTNKTSMYRICEHFSPENKVYKLWPWFPWRDQTLLSQAIAIPTVESFATL